MSLVDDRLGELYRELQNYRDEIRYIDTQVDKVKKEINTIEKQLDDESETE